VKIQPLIVVFEDLHWIDTETQALLNGLVESVPTARVLLLLNYRPEYQHGWGSRTYYQQIRIDPLPPESAHELLTAVLRAETTGALDHSAPSCSYRRGCRLASDARGGAGFRWVRLSASGAS
jgi:predicted ATPase